MGDAFGPAPARYLRCYGRSRGPTPSFLRPPYKEGDRGIREGTNGDIHPDEGETMGAVPFRTRNKTMMEARGNATNMQTMAERWEGWRAETVRVAVLARCCWRWEASC